MQQASHRKVSHAARFEISTKKSWPTGKYRLRLPRKELPETASAKSNSERLLVWLMKPAFARRIDGACLVLFFTGLNCRAAKTNEHLLGVPPQYFNGHVQANRMFSSRNIPRGFPRVFHMMDPPHACIKHCF